VTADAPAQLRAAPAGKAPPPPPAGGQAAGPTLDIFDAQLASGEVTFTAVTHAYLARFPAPIGLGAAGQPIFDKYWRPLVEAFEQRHGRIRESFFTTEGITASCALTDRDEIHLRFPLSCTADGTAEELLFQCERLAHDAVRLLDGSDRRRVAWQIFTVCTYLIGHLDRAASLESGQRERELVLIKREVDEARNALRDAAQRDAQIRYFQGVLLSAGLIVALLAFAGIVLEVRGLPLVEPGTILSVLVMGAVGAAVSVMYRMSFRRLVLDVMAGSRQLFRLGMVRPLIGAVLALALYFALGSRILRIEIPSGEEQRLYFYAAISFLAGFSERWAQDMLVVAEGRLKPAAREGASR
jgi:hypothetical protein